MKKWCLSLFLALALALSSVPTVFALNTHGTVSPLTEMQSWFGNAMSPYIVSGCLPTVPAASLTLTAFACQGYVDASAGGDLIYVDQAAHGLGPVTNTDGIDWLAIHRDTSTAVGGWNRASGTHYLWQRSATRPADPTGALVVASWTVAGAVITSVQDLRPFVPLPSGVVQVEKYASFTAAIDAYDYVGAPSVTFLVSVPLAVITPRTVPPHISFAFIGTGRLTVSNGVTLTVEGTIQAACTSGVARFVLTGTGLVVFPHQPVCPQWWGAYDDGTHATETTAAGNQALASLVSGGEMRLPAGTYLIQAVTNSQSWWVRYDKTTVRGVGPSSIIQTVADDDTALCVSKVQACTINSATLIEHVTIRDLTIQGTGVTSYTALYGGRGIIVNAYNDVMIRDNRFLDLSMIGVTFAGGSGDTAAGNGSVINNYFKNNRFGGPNFNGRTYGGLIQGNTIEDVLGFDGASNCIQTTGQSSVIGNTCINSVGYGILWGEADYYSAGVIANNVIKGTGLAGIHAQYHPGVQILGNTVINASLGNGTFGGGVGGIAVVGGTTGGLTIPTQDVIVANNFVLNSGIFPIHVSAENALVIGNNIKWLSPTFNPTASTTAQDYIVAGPQPNVCISIMAERASVRDNHGENCIYGWVVSNSILLLSASGNIWPNHTTASFAWVNAAGTVTSAHPDIAFTHIFGYSHAESYTTGGIPPTEGRWSKADRVYDAVTTAGSTEGWTDVAGIVTAMTAPTAALGTSFEVTSTTGMATGDVVTIYHATSRSALTAELDTVVDPTHFTVVTGGIAMTTGSEVRVQRWKAFGSIAP